MAWRPVRFGRHYRFPVARRRRSWNISAARHRWGVPANPPNSHRSTFSSPPIMVALQPVRCMAQPVEAANHRKVSISCITASAARNFDARCRGRPASVVTGNDRNRIIEFHNCLAKLLQSLQPARPGCGHHILCLHTQMPHAIIVPAPAVIITTGVAAAALSTTLMAG